MKKTIVLLLGLITINSIAQSTKVIVKIDSIADYGNCTEFAYKAAHLLELVLNSEEFKNQIKIGEFTQKKGLTNEELLQKILTAHEIQGAGGNDGVIDLRLRTIKKGVDDDIWQKRCPLDSHTGTIGIDGLGDGICAICPESLNLYCNTNDLASLAAHFMHEYMHILGFEHAWYSKYRSAVYKIGDIVENIINTSYKNQL